VPGREPSLKALLEDGAASGAFPGAVLVHGRPEAGVAEGFKAGFEGLTRHRVRVSADTAYDLASLTKVLATTTLAMIAADRGLLALDGPLSELGFKPPEDLSALTVSDLLTHQSGLPAWLPYHVDPELSDKERLIEAILTERPLFPIGGRTLYSDLNFMLLGVVLERLFGSSLAELFEGLVAAPLGLKSTGFYGSRFSPAPTEDGPRIGGPLDWPGAPVLGPVPTGRVHDDNAAALGGAAGHAGLFGTAPEVFKIIRAWAKSLNWSEKTPGERGGADAGKGQEAASGKGQEAASGKGQEAGFGKGQEAALGRGQEAASGKGQEAALGRGQEAASGRGDGPSFDQPRTLIGQKTMEAFLAVKPSREDRGRAAGFDLGLGAMEGAVGHLGYTGGTLWWDPKNDLALVFLCNRVHPTARNSKMPQFRERLYEALGWAEEKRPAVEAPPLARSLRPI
jgi:CubicO group peptidase (beta-lactamase class C family)